MCHEIFDLLFFHDSNQPKPLINSLKYFRIQFRFCRDIQIFKKLCGVHHTVESSSTVCIILWSQAPRCALYHGVKLRGVHPTGESSSAACITPWSQMIKSFLKTQRCASHRGVRICGVHPSVESSSTVCIIPLTWVKLRYQVSVLIWYFTNAISLWCLIILQSWS